MERDGGSKAAWVHYLLVIVLICAVVASFFGFVRENNRRILAQNQEYARDAAVQTAIRVEDMLDARAKTLNLLSITVTNTIEEPFVGQDFLKLLQETSVFDYVEFIDPEGLNHNADGVTSDSSDRKNYLRGIQGETGYHVIFNSRITHETLVNFYAPVYFQGEIIGVLNGMFREESLREAITVKFFDIDAKSFLCMSDGTVISSYGYDSPVGNFLNDLYRNGTVSEDDYAGIQNAFAAHGSFSYIDQGASVTLVPIDEDWMLVQTYPSSVTTQMQSSANSAGIKLELRLIILCLIYVAYLVITNLHKRSLLTSEKIRLSGIVEALEPLFARLVIVDPGKRSYEYLKGAPSDLPAKGDLTSLGQYMNARYINDEDVNMSLFSLGWDKIKESLGEGAPYLQFEYCIHWGEDCWENASVLSVRQEGSEPVSLILAIQDVTALKRSEGEIQQTLRDAFHTAEDLSRAKSDFLARMSHDMRTPMNAVLGMTSIALSHLDDSDRVRNCLEKIDASGHKLLRLIDEVLDMSKIESGGIALNEEMFDLTGEIDSVLDGVRSAAEKSDLTLITDITPFDHSDVFGDAERLKQVLRNLLDNAVRYTPSGGTVTFRARELPSRTPKSGYFEFVVEDTGVGIDPDFQDKIFEPFVRGEPHQGDLGTGLGLPIALTIAKLMNGDIKTESELGHGAKFTVHIFLKLQGNALPQAVDREEAVECQEEKACAEGEVKSITRHAGIRVLLVEDNDLNMEIALELLETAGLLVETAENGAEAVAMARNKPPAYYDLIFMDLQMPVMDGYEASREIRASGREDLEHIPITAVSANAFQEDVSKAQDVGMNDLVMKPVDLDRLLAALDKWLPKGK